MSTMESIQPAPRPAEPTLASSLLDEKELDSIINESYSKKPGPRIADGRIGTGIRSVDEALGGSLRAEGVVCVSGELGVGVGGIDVGLPSQLCGMIIRFVLSKTTTFLLVGFIEDLYSMRNADLIDSCV